MTKYYCPPTGGHPQELPDYWKFFNGVIRTDLQTLGDTELNLWGWDGPFTHLTAKQTINTANLSEERIGELSEDENYIFDDATDTFTSVNFDYDPETHKSVWYSKERKFIILPKDEDTSEYDIKYMSGVVPPSPSPNVDVPPIEVSQTLPPPPPVLWDKFKEYLFMSVELNQYIALLSQVMPIVASSLSVAISKLDTGSYGDFKLIWSIINKDNHIPSDLITEIINMAIECNMHQEFITILEN
jgi:hypothetical protein